ncbi:MAG: SapC family protein [Qipengyuania sp.]|nr:SapC family protein [Qipengyuania sp.]
MSNHQILNPADHADLRVHTGAGSELGDGIMATLAVPSEFRRLACEYPILFRHDPASGGFTALALLGFEDGENLFLDGNEWRASLKPLSIAIRPFLVGRSREAGGPGQVHIDIDHPRVSTSGEGTLVFDEAGRPTPFLEEIAAMLGALDEGHRASGAFFAALDRYDLIEPFALDVAMPDGGQHRLVGYHHIHEEKLAALEPGALAELHAGGHLAPAHAALTSLGNLAKLARRKAERARG